MFAFVVAAALSSSVAEAAWLELAPAGTPLVTCGKGIGSPNVACPVVGGSDQPNDIIGGGVTVQDKSVLKTTASNVVLQFYYLGSESGYKNTLTVDGGGAGKVYEEGKGGNTGLVPLNLLTNAELVTFTSYVQAVVGAIDMVFTSSGVAGSFTNAANGAAGAVSIAFAFLKSLDCTASGSIKNCISGTPTDYVLFGLDDSGADENDNHDDWMGIVMASRDPSAEVPLPAAAWLLLAGLAGLFGVSPRRAA
jgi:hypothetical protein